MTKPHRRRAPEDHHRKTKKPRRPFMRDAMDAHLDSAAQRIAQDVARLVAADLDRAVDQLKPTTVANVTQAELDSQAGALLPQVEAILAMYENGHRGRRWRETFRRLKTTVELIKGQDRAR